MAHIKIHEELVEFAGKVPEKVAAFDPDDGESLRRTMLGIYRAALSHGELLLQMQQRVTAADSGMAAYKEAARTIDANYTGTDALNATEQQKLADLATDASSVVSGNAAQRPQDVVEPGMPQPLDLGPGNRLAAPLWNDYDGLPNTMPGTGAAPVPDPEPVDAHLPPAPPRPAPPHVTPPPAVPS